MVSGKHKVPSPFYPSGLEMALRASLSKTRTLNHLLNLSGLLKESLLMSLKRLKLNTPSPNLMIRVLTLSRRSTCFTRIFFEKNKKKHKILISLLSKDASESSGALRGLPASTEVAGLPCREVRMSSPSLVNYNIGKYIMDLSGSQVFYLPKEHKYLCFTER